MNFKERKLAITDVESTGDVPGFHEMLEIGLVICDPQTFEIYDKWSVKIKPKHFETAIPKAMERNSYKEEDWREAGSLEDAMKIYSEKTKDCVFYAYNVTFDWAYISHGFKTTGVKDQMDYHRFDVMSMVYQKFGKQMESASSNTASKILGIPEEIMPHSALNGALQAYEMLKRL
jgi:DNA polymerase III alpha subunit (gram-positive type)